MSDPCFTGEGPDDFPGEPPIPLSRSELVLVRQAVKSRWPIPPAYRRRLLARLGSMLLSDLTQSRTLLGIAKALEAMDRLNLEQERRDQQIPEYHEHRVAGEIVVTAAVREAATKELEQWRRDMATRLNSPSAPQMQLTSPTNTA